MSQKKTVSRNIFFVLASLAMVAIIALGASLIVYSQQSGSLKDKNNQIALLQSQLGTPKLMSIGLQYTDNRSDTNAPFLRITGYVVNVGSTKANNCTIQVNAVQNGNVTGIDTTKTITSLDAGAYEPIDIQFPYTGDALVAYTSQLAWTN
ncbi:MAG TPA: hypothetical protein VLU95_05685 [Candidatus Acidoferrum sp.]|nr:hypothetical protein [Candidatus Acidoferrum sp.]